MKLNNKGYLIVEVILAGVLTFTMAYFLINLTLKIRNRYDDVNVETVMLNDKTVITNEIMDDVIGNKVNNVEYITNGIRINFDDGTSKDLTIGDNTITYGTYTKKFSENAIVGEASIRRNGNYFLVEIPITTKYSDKDFGINIVGFTKEALAPLTCSLSASGSTITASFDGNMIYYGWDVKVSPSCDTGYTLNAEKTSCSKTYKSEFVPTASGSCECVSTVDGSIHSGTCSLNGWGTPVCFCPSSCSGCIQNGGSCSPGGYSKCSSGDTLSSDYKTCTSKRAVKQDCPDGYTKINNNTTYCSK